MGQRLALGVATGLVLGLLTSLLPFIVILVILALVVWTVISVIRRREPSRTNLLAGTLVGAGAVLLFGALNTFAACVDTADCGNANVWSLGALAVVTIGVGTVAAGVVAFRTAP